MDARCTDATDATEKGSRFQEGNATNEVWRAFNFHRLWSLAMASNIKLMAYLSAWERVTHNPAHAMLCNGLGEEQVHAAYASNRVRRQPALSLNQLSPYPSVL